MRVVMLGWEFPPYISGGLGTACYGLTKALDRAGHEVLFVLPRPIDRSLSSHVKLLAPDGPIPTRSSPVITNPQAAQEFLASQGISATPGSGLPPTASSDPAFRTLRLLGVPAHFANPYGGGENVGKSGRTAIFQKPDGTSVSMETTDPEVIAWLEAHAGEVVEMPGAAGTPAGSEGVGKTGAGAMYQGDLIGDCERYARLVVAMTANENFDVIHAHDWLTYPAGIALARVTGKPLVVHVHSTEFDRSGESIHHRVYDIERRGMLSAIRVIAVSEYTKNICTQKFGIPADKVDVVYNGIEDNRLQPTPEANIKAKDKIVLFLGRITMQKGPEYFISAAKRVLEKVPEAKFIMAGAGDMEIRMIEMAANLGIGHRVLFSGFLRGQDVDRAFRMADVYVMPSVSEPFGIAPLEAIRNGAPVIISKSSGVSEVLTHALKVDFWDIDEMANKIVAVLKYPPLGQTMREHGSFELRRLTWDTAADACVRAYQKAGEMFAPMMQR
jgi:glycogen synthase